MEHPFLFCVVEITKQNQLNFLSPLIHPEGSESFSSCHLCCHKNIFWVVMSEDAWPEATLCQTIKECLWSTSVDDLVTGKISQRQPRGWNTVSRENTTFSFVFDLVSLVFVDFVRKICWVLKRLTIFKSIFMWQWRYNEVYP